MKKIIDTISLMNFWIIAACFIVGFTYRAENFTIVSQLVTGPIALAYQWLRAYRIAKVLPDGVTVSEIKEFRNSRKNRKWESFEDQLKLLLISRNSKKA